MKKLLQLLLIGILTGYSLGFSQSWTAQTTNSQDFFSTISMWDSQIGWAFGESGTILYTQNSGQSWSNQGISPNLDLRGSHVFNDSSVLAVGKHEMTGGGFVIRSTNGGQTWIADSVSFIQRLNDVSFGDTQTGWAVGRDGYLIKTTNSGQSWVPQTSGTVERLFSVHALNTMTVWAAGKKGVFIKSINGGSSWQTINTGDDPDYEDVFFVNSQIGWLVGEGGTILKTTNGGTSWIPQTSSTVVDLLSVEMTDSLTGWIGGMGGLVLHTTNGGLTWTSQPSAASLGVTDFSMVSNSLGWLSSGLGQISKYGSGNVLSALFNTDTDICLGETSLFSDQSTGSVFSWIWDFGDGSIDSVANPNHTFQTTGNFTVMLWVDDGMTNIDSFLLVVSVHDPMIQVNPGTTTICASGDTAMLQASGATTFTWSPPTGLSDSTGGQVFAFPSQGITYVVIGTDNFGCKDTSTATVTIDSTSSPIADFSISQNIYCNPTSIQFSNNSTSASGFQWIFPGTVPGISLDPSPVVNFTSPGLYNVTLIAEGCKENDTLLQMGFIEILPEVKADFSASTDTLYLSQGSQVNFINQSSNASSWLWDFGNGQADTSLNPSSSYQQAGTYLISLIAFEGNCSDTTSFTLIVLNASSLDNINLDNQIKIYTGPYGKVLKVEWIDTPTEPYDLTLYNISGSKLIFQPLSLDLMKEIPLQHIAKGVYIIIISSKDGRKLKKKFIR